MKQAVVFDLEQAGWGVVESFLRGPENYALVTRDDLPLAPEFAAYSDRCLALPALSTAEDLQEAEESIRDTLSGNPGLLAGNGWESLCAKHGFPPEEMRRALRRDLAREWRLQATLVDALERAAGRFTVRAVVLNEGHSPRSRALSAWARHKSIPVINLLQVLALDGQSLDSLDFQADTIAITGPRCAETLQVSGLSPDRMIQTGNPAWIKYFELAGLKDQCRAALSRLLGWGTGPLVVFGTSEAPFRTTISDPDLLTGILRAFFACARELSKTHADSIWVVILGESDPPDLEDEFKKLEKAEGLQAGRIRYYRSDAELFLAAACAVVSVDSDLTVKSLLSGTRAINVLTEYGWRTGPSFAAETGVVEISPSELRDEIAKALSGQGPDAREIAAARAAYHPAPIGESIAKVAELIERIRLPAGIQADK